VRRLDRIAERVEMLSVAPMKSDLTIGDLRWLLEVARAAERVCETGHVEALRDLLRRPVPPPLFFDDEQPV
jgi:hypothetical protein